MIDPNLNDTKLTPMNTYAQLAAEEYDIPPGGEPEMDTPEYQNGVVPLDTLPAAWWNWMWKTITEQEKRMVRFFSSIFQEFRSLLTAGGVQSFSELITDQLTTAIKAIAQTIATTQTPGALKSSASGMGTVNVNGTTGVASINGMGSTALQTTSQTVTAAINELVTAIANEINARTGADTTLQGSITSLQNNKAPNNHASGATTYGTGSSANYGHVKLSDTYDATQGVNSGVAVTPAALATIVNMIQAVAGVPTGTIIAVAKGGYVPAGYLVCNGALYPPSTYPVLFQLLGTKYGGDGVNTFGVPNLHWRTLIGCNDGDADIGVISNGLVKSHTHSLSAHTHSLSAHTHSLSRHTHGNPNTGGISADHSHKINGWSVPVVIKGQNAVDVSLDVAWGVVFSGSWGWDKYGNPNPSEGGASGYQNNSNRYTDNQSADHVHSQASTGGPSTDATGGPSVDSTGGPSVDSTGEATNSNGLNIPTSMSVVYLIKY